MIQLEKLDGSDIIILRVYTFFKFFFFSLFPTNQLTVQLFGPIILHNNSKLGFNVLKLGSKGLSVNDFTLYFRRSCTLLHP